MSYPKVLNGTAYAVRNALAEAGADGLTPAELTAAIIASPIPNARSYRMLDAIRYARDNVEPIAFLRMIGDRFVGRYYLLGAMDEERRRAYNVQVIGDAIARQMRVAVSQGATPDSPALGMIRANAISQGVAIGMPPADILAMLEPLGELVEPNGAAA